jgi:hypothetical protein
MHRSTFDSSNSENEIKYKFFEAVKNEQISEITTFFRNDMLEVWNFREEDDYTGKFIIYFSIA